jgi:hypothetical protein
MTLYIQQLQQKIVANSIEQSKRENRNHGNQESLEKEVKLEEEKVRADQGKVKRGTQAASPKVFCGRNNSCTKWKRAAWLQPFLLKPSSEVELRLPLFFACQRKILDE